MNNMTEEKTIVNEEIKLHEGTSLWIDAWKRLKKNRAAYWGGIIFVAMVILCLIGPIIMGLGFLDFHYDAQNLAYGAHPPTWKHWFGTDYHGRDILTRVLVGGRVSLKIGLIAAIVAAIVGTVYGAISGYLGGRIDNFMMRFVDVLYALPYMFLVIIFMTVTENKGEGVLFVALGLVGWLTTARIVRGQVLSIKEREFVQAAHSVGVPGYIIIFRHLIPNTLGPIIVYFTLTIPTMILQEAFLSFLGLGIQPPKPSLGTLINDGANHMLVFWWELIFPSIFMALMLFCLNFLGDGIRDALDPQMKKE